MKISKERFMSLIFLLIMFRCLSRCQKIGVFPNRRLRILKFAIR